MRNRVTMGDTIDPGEGYRLVNTEREPFYSDSEFLGHNGRWWPTNIKSYTAGLSYRVRLDAHPLPSELDTLREQVDALTAERDELRQRIAEAEKLTPERACEIVTQLKCEGRLEWRDDHRDWIVAGISENWQCRPAQPKPITLTVTCPPSQREAIEAAIRAAGGSV